jgi:hypothetical protein
MLLAATLSAVLLVFVKVFLATTLDKPKPDKPRHQAHTSSIFKDYISMFSPKTEDNV